jgi:threonine/homoserine/homoserine lactone efflux protein
VVITVIPGLDTTLVLRSALVKGRGYAMATAFGIGTGSLVWGAAAAVGAAALLSASELGYRIVTIAGAAYMVWLGVSMIVKSFRTTPDATGHGADETLRVSRGSAWRAFLVGTWTNLLNPKVGVFYIATIPQFIPDGVSHLGMGLLLAAVHDVIGLAWFALIILGASAARRWLASPVALRVIDRVAGTVLIGFGAKLALAHKN